MNKENKSLSSEEKRFFLGLFLVILAVAAFIDIFSENSKEPEVTVRENSSKYQNLSQISDFELDKYKTHKLLKVEDISFAGRNRKIVYITIDDITNSNQEALYKTAMNAAKKYQRKYRTHLLSVHLMASNKPLSSMMSPLAIVNYSPDNGGLTGSDYITWNVQAVNKMPTLTEVKIAETWQRLRKYHIRKDGSLDELALRKSIIRRLKLTPEEFSPEISLNGIYYSMKYLEDILND